MAIQHAFVVPEFSHAKQPFSASVLQLTTFEDTGGFQPLTSRPPRPPRLAQWTRGWYFDASSNFDVMRLLELFRREKGVEATYQFAIFLVLPMTTNETELFHRHFTQQSWGYITNDEWNFTNINCGLSTWIGCRDIRGMWRVMMSTLPNFLRWWPLILPSRINLSIIHLCERSSGCFCGWIGAPGCQPSIIEVPKRIECILHRLL